MEILVEAINKDKLKLKASMQNKAKALAEEIISGSIVELHNEMVDLVAKREAIEKQIDKARLKEKVSEIREERGKLEKELDRARRRTKDVQFDIEVINKGIVDLAASTQRKIRKQTDQDVKINIKD